MSDRGQVRIRLDTDTAKFWHVVREAEAEVATWPEWKQKVNVYDYLFGEEESEHQEYLWRSKSLEQKVEQLRKEISKLRDELSPRKF